ncbi:hypothetical protein [Curtobacterium sp. ISL-83]|uniref:hypothetical protein n=1 Tax=Curtobacterium sp. ISL-83 TaxID=2819145 RepID=UPI001BE80919|nr:hypothetical protein [Curtobacterium sp. ISL-83]MBT2502971.1 hypothetical protein [Curtobacterium sp. ISL-83]
MTAVPPEALASLLVDYERRLKALERATQLSSSTVGDDVDTAAAVDDVVLDAVVSNDAVPDLQDDVADGNQGVTDLQATLAASQELLDALFDDAAQDLSDARDDIAEAQQALSDAFDQRIDGVSGDVTTAITAAGTAQQSAEYARDLANQANTLAGTANSAASDANAAALAASGLAASKGQVIVQPSAPTGTRAGPANLWINTTADANGNPKNQPNRYNPDTAKWEPITDQKVIDAAATAAAANTLAASASTAAGNALTAAGTAQTTADNAKAAAASAQTTADTAKTNAATAQTAADAARARADALVAQATNVILDPSFEDTSLWTLPSRFTFATDQIHAGTRSVKVTANAAQQALDLLRGKLVSVQPGQVWRARAWRLTSSDYNGTAANGKLRLADQSGNSIGAASWNVTGAWAYVDIVYTVPASGVTALGLTASADHTVGTLWLDDVELKNITDAKQALDAAGTAQQTADTAKTNAQTAQTTADAAKTAATTAQTTADAAKTAAATAQSTADTAKTNAATAQSTADGANTAALNAAGIANAKGKVIVQVSAPTGANAAAENLWIDVSNNASGVPKNTPNRWNPTTSKWEVITDQKAVDAAAAAATAQSAATTAKTAADAAQSTADAAKTAAATAQTTADTAKTNAATAQSTADGANSQALAAAGIANGKGKVIYQATAPTGANAATSNLWIRSSDNKPFTYDGTNWNAVTDKAATDAAAAAAAANTAAQNAANAATAAQATADGKPLILFSTSGPSGTAPTGSTWFQVNTAQSVIGYWQQTGTVASPTWTARPIASDVIANLDVGKLTAGTAAIAQVVAQKIAASTATFQTVNVANLFVTDSATMQQAVIDYLFVNVVQAKKITADMIDVNSLNGVTLTGTILQTAASGKRVVLGSNVLKFYDDNGLASGQVEGTNYGGSRSQMLFTSAGYSVRIGPQDLPVAGTAGFYTASAYLGELWVDHLYDSGTNARYLKTIGGTATHSASIGTGSFGTGLVITFPSGTFTTAPFVQITSGNSRLNVAAANVSATGFRIDSGNFSGATANGPITFWWTATGS